MLVTDAMSLLANLQTLVASLLKIQPAFAVVPLGTGVFMQVLANGDGSLRLESSASAAVLASNLGFDDIVEQYEHVAGANIPAEWKCREMIAAETMMRLAVNVHGVQFPAHIGFRVSLVE